MVELRRHLRAPLDVAVEFVVKGSTDRSTGRCKDISLGGMFIQMLAPLPFGTELVVHLWLPGNKAAFALPSVVRWTRPAVGMGVQFGLIGARETHAVTELTRSTASGRGPGSALSS